MSVHRLPVGRATGGAHTPPVRSPRQRVLIRHVWIRAIDDPRADRDTVVAAIEFQVCDRRAA